MLGSQGMTNVKLLTSNQKMPEAARKELPLAQTQFAQRIKQQSSKNNIFNVGKKQICEKAQES